MADPDEAPAADRQTDETEIDADQLPGASESTQGHLPLVLYAAVSVLAAAAGYGAAVLGGCRAGEPTAPAQAGAAEPTRAPARVDTGEAFQYIDFEPITVHLDEPRLTRYVSVSLSIAIRAEQYNPDVQVVIERKKRVLVDWLTVYFASCSLDDVRGAVNMNRMRREILDAFNQELWPDQRPLVNHVLFKQFVVK